MTELRKEPTKELAGPFPELGPALRRFVATQVVARQVFTLAVLAVESRIAIWAYSSAHRISVPLVVVSLSLCCLFLSPAKTRQILGRPGLIVHLVVIAWLLLALINCFAVPVALAWTDPLRVLSFLAILALMSAVAQRNWHAELPTTSETD